MNSANGTEMKEVDYIQPNLPPKCLYDKNNLKNNPHSTVTRNSEQKIYPNILHCIGNTPLIKLNKIPESMGIQCDVLVKCEFLNPGGSIKDRPALSMIQEAESQGLLKPGSVMIETTSGNTGIAMAMVSAVKGNIFVFPEKSSVEKEDILKALGGQIVRTSDKIPYHLPGGVFHKPKELQNKIPNSIVLNQFYNSHNPLAHYHTTSAEIVEQCDGKVDMVAMGVGTGGTMTGIGRRLKELVPECLIVGVDPYGSSIADPPSLNETDVTFFEVEGIGHSYCPTTLDKRVADFWVKVGDKEALNMARRLHREEGLLCGASSGTILCGALEGAKKLKKGQTCIAILPDGVANYLSKFTSDYWMEARNLIPCPNTYNHWWWDDKVSVLDPTVGLSISNISTCQETIDLMKKGGHKVLAVIDNEQKLLGITTPKDLLKRFFNSTVKPDDAIEFAVSDKYRTVTPNSNLGILSRILDNEGMAMVVEHEEKASNQQNGKFIGVLFPADFLQYISENRP
ncbi:hypothetical protein FQR65_LT07617 [Abscondita terminalis]|nr:hypothetical protein FQR65_LT07617 [Abscondita terminalis]